MSDPTPVRPATPEIIAAIREAAAHERLLRAAAEVKPTAEERAAELEARSDGLYLRDLAAHPKREFPHGVFDPEQQRRSRQRLRWLPTRFLLGHYRPRAWGYTILRATYADNDAAVDAAVDALSRFMRGEAGRENRGVTGELQRLKLNRQLPEGMPDTADERPAEEYFVKRFNTELVQDKSELDGASIAQMCAYFRRWALTRWHKEEIYFTAASPRLKSAILFDAETVAHLQGLAARGLVGDRDVYEAGKEFWVKMVEAEPEKRNMRPGLSDCFRVPVGLLEDYWFVRDARHPATEMMWKTDERFPGELFFTTG
ncbi:uncharacterized protein B0H64DRAFT_409644 [Chaetomium fimeti]|uniref:Uncharacterized protein n=1 Tax=Chaetomium fimeti TaxID=1854472 RepID=A0AAE0H886_9PEZI|nr:hypothetical protein B0H64DRAFT_409644 [Chaetomium fimeti]